MRKRALAAAVLAGMATQASAFQIDTSEDWEVRWDNTFKYNAMWRVKSQDRHVTQNFYAADSDYSFDKGEMVSNRVDLLSELDVIWKDTIGFRISGAAWYDHAYSNNMNQADDVPITQWGTSLTTVPGELTDDGKDQHYKGGELLDAFVFWNWEAGDVVGNLRAGRHVIYWGQSLLGTGAANSVGGTMNPLDFSKALSVPGSEAKELFMPTNKISTQIQLTDNLTMSAYYSLEWKNYRLPKGNSYFAPSTGFTNDYETFYLLDGAFLQIQNDEHPEEGEWGINFSYYFEDLGLEVSAFYLNYHDKVQNGLTGALTPTGVGALTGFADLTGGGGQPSASVYALAEGYDPALVTQANTALAGGLLPTVPAGLPGYAAIMGDVVELADGTTNGIRLGYGKWTYKTDNDLYGLSFSKQIGDVSYGMDIIHKKDAPLRVELGEVVSRTLTSNFAYGLAAFAAADEDNYPHATGDTWHVVVNAIGLLNDNGIWEGGSYIVEATFSMLDSIEDDSLAFLISQDPNNTGEIDVDKGRVASHLAAVFRPTWYQVFPGVDMTMPISISIGIDGNGTSSFMGDEESGSASIGLDFNVNQKWSASIRYSNYFGPEPNSFGNLLKDRDNVAVTFKRTF